MRAVTRAQGIELGTEADGRLSGNASHLPLERLDPQILIGDRLSQLQNKLSRQILRRRCGMIRSSFAVPSVRI